jgi:hypothetical protein
MEIEGEEFQAKGIHNIFHTVITENFPNLKKVLPIQAHQTDLTKIEPAPMHIIIKTTGTENRERLLKAVREKK